jgi:hypothetical protein
MGVDDISCPSPGACVAVGFGNSKHGRTQLAFVDQHGGSWGAPVEVPVPNRTWWNHEHVACSSADVCVSGDGVGNLALISPRQRKWSAFYHLPFRDAESHSLLQWSAACSPRGECWSIVKHWAPKPGEPTHEYAVGEVNGHWVRPYQLGSSVRIDGRQPGNMEAQITCPSPHSCTVAGIAYSSVREQWRNFVQTEVDGVWGTASVEPPTKSNPFRLSWPVNLTCTQTTCLLGGTVGSVGAVVVESSGHWQSAVAGIGASNPYLHSEVLAVGCDGAGLCIATGDATHPNGNGVPFVQADVNGRWLAPLLVTKPKGLSYAFSTQAVCPKPGTCDVVVQESQAPGMRFPTLVATYSGSRWRYSLITFNGVHYDVGIMDVSCAQGSCWMGGGVSGQAFRGGEGVAIPFPR